MRGRESLTKFCQSVGVSGIGVCAVTSERVGMRTSCQEGEMSERKMATWPGRISVIFERQRSASSLGS